MKWLIILLLPLIILMFGCVEHRGPSHEYIVSRCINKYDDKVWDVHCYTNVCSGGISCVKK